MAAVVLAAVMLATPLAPPALADDGPPDWVEPMRAVHARFAGQQGTFAQLGDSITESRAFWTSLRWTHSDMPPEMDRDLGLVTGYMREECWDGKGPENGNQGGQTVAWALANVSGWLETLNPEAAIVMFGTNDLNGVSLEDYEGGLRDLVSKCLDHGTVVVLSTIPPRHGFEEQSTAFAEAARRVARDLDVPLTDFHADILRRRPTDWDGALDQFREYEGYEVPTLISRDGVHPSNPARYSGVYSAEALDRNGFSLRNYLALTAYGAVIREVLAE